MYIGSFKHVFCSGYFCISKFLINALVILFKKIFSYNYSLNQIIQIKHLEILQRY